MTDDERAVEDFEVAWMLGDRPPDITQAINSATIATELVLIDMECRWRFSSRAAADAIGVQPRWDDYERLLNVDDANLRMRGLSEEYRSRQLWGDQPNHDHFVARCPKNALQLARHLRKIDEELAADGLMPRNTAHVPRTTEADPRAPLPFQDFLIQQHLGSGGMGRVYRAHQVSLDRPVAIKALRKSFQLNKAYTDRFLEEAKLLAKLEHPNIVRIYGVGRFPGGGYFIAMQLIEGENLDAISRSFSEAESVQIANEVVAAVGFAHENQILHGDLKPQNILVSDKVDTFVSDFGLGQRIRVGRPTMPLGGTANCVAPEIEKGEPLTVATDIYGLGVVLRALARRCQSKRLFEVSENCLQAEATQRFGSCNELLRHL